MKTVVAETVLSTIREKMQKAREKYSKAHFKPSKKNEVVDASMNKIFFWEIMYNLVTVWEISVSGIARRSPVKMWLL